MSAPKIHFQCQIAQLGPDYSDDKVPWFCVALAAAFADKPVDAADVRTWLQPWNWENLKLMMTSSKDNGTTWEKEEEVKPLPGAVFADKDFVPAALTQELQRQLEKNFVPEDFIWQPEATTPPPVQSWSRDRRDWRSFLGHLATYPGGFGTGLNLLFVFQFPRPLKAGEIVLAAPDVTINGFQFTPAADKITNGPEVYRWNYKDEAAAAYANVPAAPTSEPTSFINLKTLWRNQPDKTELRSPRAWVDDLARGLPAVFDWPKQLLEYLRSPKLDVVPVDALKDAFLRGMFEVIRGGVDGATSLFDGRQLSALPKEAGAQFEPPIIPADPPSDHAVPAWWNADLETILKQHAGANLKLEFWPKKQDKVESAGEWGAILSVFQQFETLQTILLKIWQEDAKLSADDWARLEPALKQELVKRRWHEEGVLHALLLEHAAGQTWRLLLPPGMPAGAELQRVKTDLEKLHPIEGEKIWKAEGEDKTRWETVLSAGRDALLEPLTSPQRPQESADDLLIQIDKIERHSTDKKVDNIDYLRHVAGAGVLLRCQNNEAPEAWRLLNWSRPELLAASTAATTEPEFGEIYHHVCAAPWRLAYGRGVREGFLRYANQPLLGVSPWARFAERDFSRVPDSESSGGGSYSPLLRHRLAYEDIAFRAEHILNLKQFTAELLKERARFLTESFPPETQALLKENSSDPVKMGQLFRQLARELNRVLAGESIYTEKRFKDVVLGEDTKALLAVKPDGVKLMRLNRLLLADFFPGLLAREAGARLRLTRLVYGCTYEAAVFYFNSYGLLPRELAAKNGGKLEPWKLALPGPKDLKKDTHYVVLPSFKRATRIGGLRISAKFGQAFPPLIPENVHPITRALAAKKAAKRENVDALKNHQDQEPLVLLLPQTKPGDRSNWDDKKGISTQAGFEVRPPQVDAKVWDRWQDEDPAGTTASADHRKSVLAEVHHSLQRLRAGHQPTPPLDPTLDDPAVLGLAISFQRVWPDDQELPGFEVEFTGRTQPTEIQKEQKKPIQFVLESADVKQPEWDPKGSEVHIKFPRAEAWRVRLKITPVKEVRKKLDQQVEKEAFEDTFESLLVEVAQPLQESSTADKALFAATSFVRAPKDLNSGPADQEQPKTDALELQLQTSPAMQPHLLHRVELVMQRWRWNGLPVYQMPWDPLNTDERPVPGVPFENLNKLERFDGDWHLFGTREDLDSREVATVVEFAPPDSQAATLHTITWPVEPGLLYYRFIVRARSRYEGLLKEPENLDSSRQPSQNDEILPKRWLRYARECTWPKTVPKPNLNLILPLTEVPDFHGRGEAFPGWMLLLDEEWYLDSMGGLGEQLRSEIVSVRLPDDPNSRQQAGFDPILDMTDAVGTHGSFTLPPPLGAIGTTFDSDTSAPQFVNTQFYQPAPVLPLGAGTAPVDLSFAFFKLRFQRILAGRDREHPRPTKDYPPLTSEWTDGYWLQILPPSNRWTIQTVAGEKMARVEDLLVQVAPPEIQWTDPDTHVMTPIKVLPSGPRLKEDGHCEMRLLILLTRTVSDAFGRPDRECFSQIGSYDQFEQLMSTAKSLVNPKFRLLEVQLRRPHKSEFPTIFYEGGPGLKQLAEILFPLNQDVENPEDASARIVRISTPIGMSPPDKAL